MKNFILFTALILFFTCCKKKKTDDNDNNNNQGTPCELPIGTFKVNGSNAEIAKDTIYVNGDTNITTEQIVSSSKYCLLDFGGDQKPEAGKYYITNNYLNLMPGSNYCFVQLVLNTENFYGQSGELEVYNIGARKFFKSCNINCKDNKEGTRTLEICGEIK